MAVSDILEYGGAFGGTAIPDTVVLANTGAWHETGVVLDTQGEKGLTIEQALEASGLNFEVIKTPIYGPQGQEIERRYGVQRTDTEAMLGVVGEVWVPFQPKAAFALVDDLIQQAGGKQAWIESAGTIDGGRKIWVMVHLDTELQIAGEAYRSYLLFSTGFDGRLSTSAAAVDERVVCANTLNFALYGEAKESGYVVRVRHTKNASERIKEAHAVLGMRNQRAEELAKQGEWLVAQEFDEGEFASFLEELMPLDEQQAGKPAETMIKNRRDKVRSIYFDAENLKPIRGTKWGAFQAVLEYADHGRDFTNVETQTKAQLGLSATPIKQRAFDLVCAAD